MTAKRIFITGPAGSGKTTIAKQLCRSTNKAVRVDIDRLKHLIQPGSLDYFYPENQLGSQQWDICVQNTINVTNNFSKLDDFLIIIDGFLPKVEHYHQIINTTPVNSLFLLLPPKKEAYQQNQERTEKYIIEEKEINRHYDFFKKNLSQFPEHIKLEKPNLTVEEKIATIQSSI